MKKFLIALSFICILGVGQIQAEADLSWKDIDKQCFRKSANLEVVPNAVNKISAADYPPLFFEQNQELVAFKVFDYADKKPVPYKIIDIKGAGDNSNENQKFLYDGNNATALSFDPFQKEEKLIEIDAGKLMKAGDYRLKFSYRSDFVPRYFIAKEEDNFIEVRNVYDFDWRYLRVIFENNSDFDGGETNSTLQLQELAVLESAQNSYLIKTKDATLLTVYADYDCADYESVQKLLSDLNTDSQQTQFAISVDTPLWELDLGANPNYNNDFDADGLENDFDNCPYHSNVDQSDIDQDLRGDKCDFDSSKQNFYDTDNDNDGVGNSVDNCPDIYNPRQVDSNADKKGDLCSDDDQDGLLGYKDNCVLIANSDQKDININGVGDACEFDKDQDEIFDSIDNCMNVFNPEQKDQDQDGIGDLCDNCEFFNPKQYDSNGDGKGDLCSDKEKYAKENDDDKDGVLNNEDNCPLQENAKQLDQDQDGVGDVCDNCPKLQNPEQKDQDENKVGDLCEDSDRDGILGYLDNCVYHANSDQKDSDNDGIGDLCEDDDGDEILAADDNCPFVHNSKQWDSDGDGQGNECDESDDRFLESNKWVVISGIVLITIVFAGGIFIFIKKLK